MLHQDYVRTARAKGLRETTILTVHVFKNAAIPVITVVGLHFGILLGGTVVTETIFAWPGLGRLIVNGISLRDFLVGTSLGMLPWCRQRSSTWRSSLS